MGRNVEREAGWPDGSPVLAQRAASEGPRWTARSGGSLGTPLEGVEGKWKEHLTLPAHLLAGVHKRDAPYSSRRGPHGTRVLRRASFDVRSWERRHATP